MKLLLSALAIVGMLLVGGTVIAPAFATSPPVCTIFSHPAGCVEPGPIFANAGGDGCTKGYCKPASSSYEP
jgi:hypothetical protein